MTDMLSYVLLPSVVNLSVVSAGLQSNKGAIKCSGFGQVALVESGYQGLRDFAKSKSRGARCANSQIAEERERLVAGANRLNLT